MGTDSLFLYDQALAALALVQLKRLPVARTILNALANLQRDDGSWYFAYKVDGSLAFSSRADYRYAGAIAWVVLAFNAYHIATGSLEYLAVAERALDYLRSQVIVLGGGAAIRFNPSDLPETSWDERLVASAEHALDALSAFRGHAFAIGREPPILTELLQRFLNFRRVSHHVEAGFQVDVGANTTESYLDVFTWSSLALNVPSADATALLNTACQNHSVPDGFRPDNEAPSQSNRVWPEGTLGWVLAARLRAPGVTCRGRNWRHWLATMERQVDQSGSLPELLSDGTPAGLSQSTAATAWLVFAQTGFNPFSPRASHKRSP